jgi:hypothetical protein
MTSERGVEGAVSLGPLRRAVEASRKAPSTPARVHNRLMSVMREECARLAATPAGRDVLVRAAGSDSDPWVRLAAATAVETWDPSEAAETFVTLVTAAGGRVTRPMTMTAALAVRNEVGKAAALCLLNLDGRGGAAAFPFRSRRGGTPGVRVLREQLDAAEKVYSLAMNGGIDHAYVVAGAQFAAAAAGFEAVGATTAAHVLRDALRVVGAAVGVPEERATREAAVLALPANAEHALSALGDSLSQMDDLMDRLESAADG